MASAPVRQAVILAGGAGIRLRPYTYDRPKPMVLVNGKPFVQYLVEMLKENGITEIVFLLGYLPEKITEYFGDGSKFGVKISYSVGALDDGTGTRVRNAEAFLHDRFLLLYSDNFIHLDLSKLLAFHEMHRVPMTVTVYRNAYGFTKNNMFVGTDGMVATYDKGRTNPNLNGVDLGFFIVEKKEIIEMMSKENFYLEEKILPALIARKALAGFVVDHHYFSLSNPERLRLTERALDPHRKFIFLERDGVVNVPPVHGQAIVNPSDFHFLPHAIEGMALLKSRGYEIYVTVNQDDGAPDIKEREKNLFDVHKEMEHALTKQGTSIDGIFYCLHGASAGCLCRMPKAGMLFEAAIEHQLDLSRAHVVAASDPAAAAGAFAGATVERIRPNQDLFAIAKALSEGVQ